MNSEPRTDPRKVLLGSLPTGWKVKPLKHVAKNTNSGVWGDEPELSDAPFPVVRTSDIDGEGNIVVDFLPLRALSNRDWERNRCSPGDILVVKSSGSATNVVTGKAACVRDGDPPYAFSNFLMRLQPVREHVEQRFLFYYVSSHAVKERVKAMVAATTYPNLRVGEYLGFDVAVPPLFQQRAIADFLDRKTQAIDFLIQKKERLVELLQEKRQAFITRAVTKGLDPSMPMKDADIEWLGEIPAHWDRAPVYARYEVQLGKMLDAKRITGDHLAPYLRNVDVQ